MYGENPYTNLACVLFIVSLWKSMRWDTLSNVLSLVLTIPSGSTSSRCFLTGGERGITIMFRAVDPDPY